MIHGYQKLRAGFTLIEIMIVIAIIAILAAIVVPSFVQARAEANLQACRKNLQTLGNAVMAFSLRHSVKDVWNGRNGLWRSEAGLQYYDDGYYRFGGVRFLCNEGLLPEGFRCPSWPHLRDWDVSYEVQYFITPMDYGHGPITGWSLWCSGCHIVGDREICPSFDLDYGIYDYE